MNQKIFNLIKITSTLLISCALALECWNIYLNYHDASLPVNLKNILRLGNVALLVHGIEGFVAALRASSQAKNPLTYGIYTFFVGFPGLKELDPGKN